MDLLTTIIWFLIALVVLVAVHEYGHFLVARLCGVKVLRFSIGFGNRMVSWYDKHGTEFAISTIPLGGYVKMLDEREMDVEPEERHLSFNAQPPWKRIAIAAAGPIANLLLAIVFFWVILFFRGSWDIAPIVGKLEEDSLAARAGLVQGQEIVAVDNRPTPSRIDVYLALFKRLGESGDIVFTLKYPDSELEYDSNVRIDNWLRGQKDPDVFGGLGLTLQMPMAGRVISKVEADSAADKAGFKADDELLEVNGEQLDNGEQWKKQIYQNPGEEVVTWVRRDGRDHKLVIVPEERVTEQGEAYGFAGVYLPAPPDMARLKEYGFFEAIRSATDDMWETIDMVFLSIKKLIVKEISLNNLSGPIGIAKVAGDSAKAGIWAFFGFLATLSVYLGVLNLLPIPVLDGGHIVYSVIEWVKGSPIPEKIQLLGVQAGMAMLLCLVVVASFYDIFG